MEKLLYQPFELQVKEEEQWENEPLIYHFFEIVHILEGSGSREVNYNKFNYRQGDTYLFTALDCRGFQSDTKTRFCSIRFSEIFISQYRQPADRNRAIQWLKQLEHIFSHHNRFQCLQVTDKTDQQIIAQLIGSMIAEYQQQHEHYQENMHHFISLLLNILSRNLVAGNQPIESKDTEEPLINKMLIHIRQYINQPAQLKIESLARQFNLSANYVSEYFRKFTGVALQTYITTYKIRLVEERLKNSELTIGQIADELGFTDESHLNRAFKKHHGISPTAYRKPVKTQSPI